MGEVIRNRTKGKAAPDVPFSCEFERLTPAVGEARWEQFVDVREQTLWPGNKDGCYLANDPTGVHFAAVLPDADRTIVGVVSAFEISREPENTWQIRKFGILETNPHNGEEMRNKGLGKWLLSEGQAVLEKETDVTEFVADAREEKAGLYVRTGFEQIGEPFSKYSEELGAAEGNPEAMYIRMARRKL